MATEETTVELREKMAEVIDERFQAESKIPLITNNLFNFDGAHSVKVYEVTTADMHDYDREGTGTDISRYGKVQGLNSTTKTYEMKKDRSFTYVMDTLDMDENGALDPSSTLDRQVSEVVIPEIDTYTYNEMIENAGNKAAATAITEENIYNLVLQANERLDEEMVPETDRCIIVTPKVYTMLKRNKDFLMSTDLSQDIKLKGVVAIVDGLKVIRVPQARLNKDFGFMVCHNSATCTPVKLAEFNTHINPPGISGVLVEGRIAYDSFVIKNKAKGIYYQPISE